MSNQTTLVLKTVDRSAALPFIRSLTETLGTGDAMNGVVAVAASTDNEIHRLELIEQSLRHCEDYHELVDTILEILGTTDVLAYEPEWEQLK